MKTKTTTEKYEEINEEMNIYYAKTIYGGVRVGNFFGKSADEARQKANRCSDIDVNVYILVKGVSQKDIDYYRCK